MLIQKKIKVVEKIQKDYDVNGNTGTSYKVRALVDEQDIFEFKFNAETLVVFNQLPSKGDVDVTISITAPKEVIKSEIVSVDKK